jgi:hypothetical protein
MYLGEREMSLLKRSGLMLSLVVVILLIQMAPVQAAMVSTSEVMNPQSERVQLVNILEREDVQRQLIGQGVDPVAALARVDQMSDEEVAKLNGQIENLPSGAGLSTVDLLLIIIILLII